MAELTALVSSVVVVGMDRAASCCVVTCVKVAGLGLTLGGFTCSMYFTCPSTVGWVGLMYCRRKYTSSILSNVACGTAGREEEVGGDRGPKASMVMRPLGRDPLGRDPLGGDWLEGAGGWVLGAAPFVSMSCWNGSLVPLAAGVTTGVGAVVGSIAGGLVAGGAAFVCACCLLVMTSLM